MTRFMTDTLHDIHHGQQSWRVFVVFCTPAFALTLLALSLQRLF